MDLHYTVPSMACAACGDTIARAVQKIDPDATVRADPTTKRVDIDTRSPESEVKRALAAAGYPVDPATITARETEAKDRKQKDLNQDLAI